MTKRKLVGGVVLAAVLTLGACVEHKDPTGPPPEPPPPDGPTDMAPNTFSWVAPGQIAPRTPA